MQPKGVKELTPNTIAEIGGYGSRDSLGAVGSTSPSVLRRDSDCLASVRLSGL